MTERIRNISIRHYRTILDLSSFVTVGVMFLVGIGRLRVVLVISGFYLVSALLRLASQKRVALYLLNGIATIIAAYVDLTKGQIDPVFKNGWFGATSLPIVLVVELLIRSYVQEAIERFTKGKTFEVCPSCYYHNKDLVEKCAHCG